MSPARRVFIRIRTAFLAAVLVATLAAPTSARTPGQALQFDALTFQQLVNITLLDYAKAETDGGATLFASSSPGGALIARVPLLPPYQVDVEANILPLWTFNGVPPGTYYLVMISGIVAAPSVPTSAWRQIVVGGGCNGVPGIGTVVRDVNAAPGTLGLFISSSDGCGTSYELEAGTAPGSGSIGTFTNLLQAVNFPLPPPGVYYVRARGRNSAGAGAWSSVLPISVPACNPNLGQDVPFGAYNPQATVVGNTVTLTWTLATTGPAQTFQELLLIHARTSPQGIPTILLPGNVSSVTATVPSGTYIVGVVGGNQCGKADYDVVQFVVP